MCIKYLLSLRYNSIRPGDVLYMLLGKSVRLVHVHCVSPDYVHVRTPGGLIKLDAELFNEVFFKDRDKAILASYNI